MDLKASFTLSKAIAKSDALKQWFLIFTARKQSCGKVLFSHVSVSHRQELFRGECMPNSRSFLGVGMPGPRSLLGDVQGGGYVQAWVYQGAGIPDGVGVHTPQHGTWDNHLPPSTDT